MRAVTSHAAHRINSRKGAVPTTLAGYGIVGKRTIIGNSHSTTPMVNPTTTQPAISARLSERIFRCRFKFPCNLPALVGEFHPSGPNPRRRVIILSDVDVGNLLYQFVERRVPGN